MSFRRLEVGPADRPPAPPARITARGVQIGLGAVWLIAGVLQLQGYMYTHAFVAQVLDPGAVGQPGVIGDPITTFAGFYGRNLVLSNTLAAELQCALGLGLILTRRTVRPALAVSFVWAAIVWWFGEGFGRLASNVEPSPLMGAPGAVVIYALVGFAVWPSLASAGEEPGSADAINDRFATRAWAGLWVVSAVLWCVNVNRSDNAIHDMLAGMAAGSPPWLARWQTWAAGATAGHGEVLALGLAVVSLIVGVGVFSRALRVPVVAIGSGLAVVYWVFGQSLGGPFWAGEATDVNAGPLFVLLGLALIPGRSRRPGISATSAARRAAASGPTDTAGARPGREIPAVGVGSSRVEEPVVGPVDSV